MKKSKKTTQSFINIHYDEEHKLYIWAWGPKENEACYADFDELCHLFNLWLATNDARLLDEPRSVRAFTFAAEDFKKTLNELKGEFAIEYDDNSNIVYYIYKK